MTNIVIYLEFAGVFDYYYNCRSNKSCMKHFAFFAAALVLFTSCVKVDDTPES